MICLRCDNEEFVRVRGDVVQEYKGMTITVKTAKMRCTRCGWRTIGLDQIDELCRRTREAYQRLTAKA